MPKYIHVINEITGKEDFAAELEIAKGEELSLERQVLGTGNNPEILQILKTGFDVEFIKMQINDAREIYDAIASVQLADKEANAHKRNEPIAEAYKAAAGSLGVTPAELRAVAYTETGGYTNFPDGSPKILFERHIFDKLTNGIYRKSHPRISNPNRGGYGPISSQYPKFEEAKALNEEAACESISITAYQLMGFDFKSAGDFKSAKEFEEAMMNGTPEDELNAFVSYLKCHPKDIEDLKKHDWTDFARRYNGKSYKDNNYDTKMKNNYERFKDDPYTGLMDNTDVMVHQNPMMVNTATPASENSYNALTYLFGNGIPGDDDYVPSVFDEDRYNFPVADTSWMRKKLWQNEVTPTSEQNVKPYQVESPYGMIFNTMPKTNGHLQQKKMHIDKPADKSKKQPEHMKLKTRGGTGATINIHVGSVTAHMVGSQNMSEANNENPVTAEMIARLLQAAAASAMV